MLAPENPYASPLVAGLPTEAPLSEAERIRQRHLSAEVTCKQVGLLSYLGGALATIYSGMMLSFGVALLVNWEGPRSRPLIATALLVGAGALGLLAWVHFRTARGLRRLDPRVRRLAMVLSALWMLYLPVGTLLGGHLLWILRSDRGKYLFTSEYQAIIAETPQVRQKTSLATWVLLFAGLVGLVSWVLSSQA